MLQTQAALLQKIPEWSASRLGNYEASISSPGPDDILRIAKATQSSPCWLMFGLGPIRPNARDLQAIRYQNLCNTYEEIKDQPETLRALLRALDVDIEQLQQYIDNPFQTITNTLAKHYEQHLGLPSKWMNEQHVEHDPLCLSFPEDIRELITLCSSIYQQYRTLILNTIKTMVKGLSMLK